MRRGRVLRLGSRAVAAARIAPPEFERLPLRVHAFLAGVPLHDVWVIDLPHFRPGITLDEFFRATEDRPFTPSPVVRTLLGVRLFAGRILGWDRERDTSKRESFGDRLTAHDRAQSLAEPGARDGAFRVLYRFENEELLEIANRTAHAAASTALVERADAYRYYFAVYVRSVSRLTPLYMAAIDPFRRAIVYPSLLRSVRRNWICVFG